MLNNGMKIDEIWRKQYNKILRQARQLTVFLLSRRRRCGFTGRKLRSQKFNVVFWLDLETTCVYKTLTE